MSSVSPKSAAPSATPSTDPVDDPVLTDLNQAAADYMALRAGWHTDHTELEQLRAEIAQLKRRVETQQQQVELAQRQAQRQQVRAEQLATQLKEIHRALFSGNVYTLILKACLTITGATRGLYLTARGPDDILRVRAALDVDGYPAAPLSDFVQALCHKVLADRESLIYRQASDLKGLPGPARESERFHNCLVTPVMLLHNFDGIIIAADKLNGEFDEDDVNALLSVGDQAVVAVENAWLQRELQRAYLDTVTVLADTIEVKDPYTHGHCDMVSRLARRTAAHLHLGEEEGAVVCFAALLHDIGKIGISDGILNKSGPLIPEERELMRTHARVGHDLLARVPVLAPIGQAVLHHHEFYDGNGYPEGLREDSIPIASRIVSVVDAYCAMITKRSYKDAYSDAYARAELQRCAGTQFDPQVVEAFLAVLNEPDLGDADDDAEECGLLPGFTPLRAFQHNPMH